MRMSKATYERIQRDLDAIDAYAVAGRNALHPDPIAAMASIGTPIDQAAMRFTWIRQAVLSIAKTLTEENTK